MVARVRAMVVRVRGVGQFLYQGRDMHGYEQGGGYGLRICKATSLIE